MDKSRTIAAQRPRATKRAPLASIALIGILLGAVAGGCIQNHDPRTDSSRVDSPGTAGGASARS